MIVLMHLLWEASKMTGPFKPLPSRGRKPWLARLQVDCQQSGLVTKYQRTRSDQDRASEGRLDREPSMGARPSRLKTHLSLVLHQLLLRK